MTELPLTLSRLNPNKNPTKAEPTPGVYSLSLFTNGDDRSTLDEEPTGARKKLISENALTNLENSVQVPTEARRPRPYTSLAQSLYNRRDQSPKVGEDSRRASQLNKLERYDYSVLFRYKMGLNKYGPAVSSLDSSSAASSAGAGSGSGEAKAAKKTAFDIKLKKFDAGVKIKIIQEVRTFTDLGLKEAKDLVKKAPVVVKKGVAKEEADSIMAKLKELGATVVLE